MESLIARDERLRNIAADLYERCRVEKLTVSEFKRTLEILNTTVANQTMI